MNTGFVVMQRATAVLLSAVVVTGSVAADEPAGKATAGAQAQASGEFQVEVEVQSGDESREGRKIEYRVQRSRSEGSEDDRKTAPKVTRRSRIVIIGPDGVRREFDGEDKDGRSMILQIPDGEALLKKLESEGGTEGSEPESERLMIGVRCEAADVRLRKHLKLADAGLVVLRVEEGTPAARAGIEIDDIIISVDSAAVKTPLELVERIGQSAGRAVEIVMLHNGEQKTVSVTPEKLQPGSFPAWEETAARQDGLLQMLQGNRMLKMHPGIMLDLQSDMTPEEIQKQIEQMMNGESIEGMAEALKGLAENGVAKKSETKEPAEPASGTEVELQQLKAELRELKAIVEQLKQPKL